MLILNNTDALRLTTSSAALVDVHASWTNLTTATGAVAPNRTNTAFSSATTADIVATPTSGVVTNVKTLHIRNRDTSVSCDVTVVYNQNGTAFELHKVTLVPGATLEYVEGVGFFQLVGSVTALTNFANASQTGFAADTYLVGSSIAVPGNLPKAGTTYKLRFDITKTNAGTATPIINIRYGTAGAVGDTSRLAFTFGAGSAAVDTVVLDIICVFRTVGSGTSAVIQGQASAQNILATTGWTTVIKAVIATGSGFDSTVANSFIGASYNGGASAAHTIQLVRAELIA